MSYGFFSLKPKKKLKSICASSLSITINFFTLDVEICGEDLIKQMLICVQNVVKATEEFKASSGLLKIIFYYLILHMLHFIYEGYDTLLLFQIFFYKIVDAEEDTGMVPGQFTPLLTNKFSAHLKQLDVIKVADMTELFVTSLKSNALSVIADTPSCLNVVAMAIENLRWIRFYTFNCLMLHRTSCKMLYVLFGLFTDLLKQVKTYYTFSLNIIFFL